MAEPGDPAAGGGWLRVSHANREQVIETLKDAFAVFMVGALLDRPDPGPGPGANHGWIQLCLFVSMAAVVMALGIAGYGVIAWDERRWRRRQQGSAL